MSCVLSDRIPQISTLMSYVLSPIRQNTTISHVSSSHLSRYQTGGGDSLYPGPGYGHGPVSSSGYGPGSGYPCLPHVATHNNHYQMYPATGNIITIIIIIIVIIIIIITHNNHD